jgi:hypothetical protein
MFSSGFFQEKATSQTLKKGIFTLVLLSNCVPQLDAADARQTRVSEFGFL